MSDELKLEQLASRAADGGLSADERRQLADGLVADAALRDTAGQYDRLHSLLGRHSGTRVQVNDAALSDAIREAVAESIRFEVSQELDGQLSDAQAARLDRAIAQSHALQREETALRGSDALLRRYAASTSVPEMPMLSSRISAAIRREPVAARRRQDRGVPRGIPFRRYLPSLVAAAAAIFLVVTGVIRLPQNDQPIEPPHRGAMPAPLVQFDPVSPGQNGSVDVVFDQSLEALAGQPVEDDGGMISSRAKRAEGETRGRTGTFVLY